MDGFLGMGWSEERKEYRKQNLFCGRRERPTSPRKEARDFKSKRHQRGSLL